MGGQKVGRDVCWGLCGAPLPPCTRGWLGRGGGESEAAEGLGTCGGAVPLKAAPQQRAPILFSVPR